MTMFRLLMMLFLGMSGLSSAYAGCSSSSSSSSFGSISSFTLASTAQTVESGSGFTCSGSLLSLISTNTVTATISSTSNASGSTPQLYNASTGEYIPYSICKDSGCSATYPIGDTIKWSSTTLLGLLGLFNSSDGTLPIYLRTSTGANVAAGTYTDNITLSWYYKICFVGVLGICAYTTGTDTSVVPVSMVVTNDCYIDSAPDVNFGTQALPSSFSTISNALSVRCTRNATYTVGLSSLNAGSGNWRQMNALINGSTYSLQYQFYRSDGTVWTSENHYGATGTGDSQNISYTAKINPNQSNVPAGAYSDTVTVTVTY
ncbi:spore coat protein U domain-containing protein [Lonsdalea quercina]|uniref:Csu type fimbrial protein n=1 Tax=Lonsdalea quercina TaxID=71657 RepID=UPI003974FEEE